MPRSSSLQILAAVARHVRRDVAGVQIGVDGHLLAGHAIEREARCDFRHAAGALRDHDEVDHDQDQEDDETDDDVAADHDPAKCLDDFAGRAMSLVAVEQDQARGGDVQAQP
jgi:hypothetical protein